VQVEEFDVASGEEADGMERWMDPRKSRKLRMATFYCRFTVSKGKRNNNVAGGKMRPVLMASS
jgi:hypothetical protein